MEGLNADKQVMVERCNHVCMTIGTNLRERKRSHQSPPDDTSQNDWGIKRFRPDSPMSDDYWASESYWAAIQGRLLNLLQHMYNYMLLPEGDPQLVAPFPPMHPRVHDALWSAQMEALTGYQMHQHTLREERRHLSPRLPVEIDTAQQQRACAAACRLDEAVLYAMHEVNRQD